MTKRPQTVITTCFAYNHFQTDGKLENVLEILQHIDAKTVGLSITNGKLDGPAPDRYEIADRTGRIKTVIAKLRPRGITTEIILPGLNCAEKYLAMVCSMAAQTGAKTIWLNDTEKTETTGQTKQGAAAAARDIIGAKSPKSQLGLISDRPEEYMAAGTTATEIATILAGKNKPLLAQGQLNQTDYDRTEILQAAQSIATVAGQTADRPKIELAGYIDNASASNFHKSAEATQIQISLNIMLGCNRILINCFDVSGSAPGVENPYVQMILGKQQMNEKLGELVRNTEHHADMTVIINTNINTSDQKTKQPNPWPNILWRMGLPVKIATGIGPSDPKKNKTAYVLTGEGPGKLTKTQLNHIFENGVLLDLNAAGCIQNMGQSKLIGVKVGGPARNVQEEILSDQTFAAPYYGTRSRLKGVVRPDRICKLQSLNDRARPITTLHSKDRLPNINGIMIFDDTKANHRCAVLPYSLGNMQDAAFMMSPQRHRHVQEVFAWLLRRRPGYFIENTPDLVPLVMTDKKNKRTVIALLNISFDWAIDARVRLANPPFAIKRIRQLDEDGKLKTLKGLRLSGHKDYRFLQLDPDTAVAPMQMTILSLEG